MKKISEPIVFFGSGPVAAESLRLLAPDFTIEVVITKPRPSHHKGDVPVLRVAAELGLPVQTVTSRHTLDELVSKQPLKSRLAILIDFGIIVSQDVIDAFPLGIINSHFSLLPEWRGADPITFSILSGQSQTGISLMLLVAGMDEGPLLAQAAYQLPSDITTPELTSNLIELSYHSLCEIVPLYLTGAVSPAPQEQVTLAASPTPTYSRKLTKQDGTLDFTKPAVQLEREVRAFADWPKSRTTLGGIEVTIVQAHVGPENGPSGTIWHDKHTVGIFAAEGILLIDQLKPAGKATMTAQAFLAGYGHRLES